ncbi:MAG: Ig-like domain-containing protein [Erysipelotrichales bacterium]|nr:Ig-like domain-containing protein [Erysipelotrichales bacterium]
MRIIKKCILAAFVLALTLAILPKGEIAPAEASQDIFTGWRITANNVNYDLWNNNQIGTFVKVDGSFYSRGLSLRALSFDVSFIDTGQFGVLRAHGIFDLFHVGETIGSIHAIIENRSVRNGESVNVIAGGGFYFRGFTNIYNSQGQQFGEEMSARASFHFGNDNSETVIDLILDPSRPQAGTEVTMNNGPIFGRTMTQGFTRVIFLGPTASSQARQHYIFTASNNNARVSETGTITALAPGQVEITARHRNNQFEVGRVTITILPVTSNVIRELPLTTDRRVPFNSNGSEVTSGMGVAGGNTMHLGLTRHMSFTPGALVPSSIIQDYIWTTNAPHVATVSQFGTVTAMNPGVVTITAVYRHNQNFRGSFEITVLEPWLFEFEDGNYKRIHQNLPSFDIQTDSFDFHITYLDFRPMRMWTTINLFYHTHEASNVAYHSNRAMSAGETVRVTVGGYLNFRSSQGNLNINFDLQRSFRARLITDAYLSFEISHSWPNGIVYVLPPNHQANREGPIDFLFIIDYQRPNTVQNIDLLLDMNMPSQRVIHGNTNFQNARYGRVSFYAPSFLTAEIQILDWIIIDDMGPRLSPVNHLLRIFHYLQ